MTNQMRLIISRVQLQQPLHRLLAGGYVAQPQMAQRFNKQAVLLMLLLRRDIKHHQIRERDGKKVGLRNVIPMLPGPGDKILEVLLGLRRITALTQRDALSEKVIGGLIVVVTPGVQR